MRGGVKARERVSKKREGGKERERERQTERDRERQRKIFNLVIH